MAREEDEGPAREAYGDREQRRVHGLGEEQVRHALHVADHPAAFAHHRRQRLEAAVQQHQLSHGPGGRRAGPHGDADVRFLQRQHVVHAIAGHGDHVAPALQSRDHRLFLVGLHAPEDRGGLEHRGEIFLVVRERTRVHRLAHVFHAGRPGHRADRNGVVARDHLDGDTLLVEVGQGLRRVAPHALLEDHYGRRVQRGQGLFGDVALGAGQQQHPQAGASKLRDLIAQFLV